MSTTANNADLVESNPRGIPKAPFFDQVQDAITGGSVEQTLAKFDETIKKYKFMESQLRQRQLSLNSKIPEIRTSLQTVRMLIAQNALNEPIETDFELNETLYAKAVIESAPNANVMIEYPVEEAETLLDTKYNQATTTLKQVDEDLEFLREQVTTMEVNLARVYNWDVKNRKQTKSS